MSYETGRDYATVFMGRPQRNRPALKLVGQRDSEGAAPVPEVRRFRPLLRVASSVYAPGERLIVDVELLHSPPPGATLSVERICRGRVVAALSLPALCGSARFETVLTAGDVRLNALVAYCTFPMASLGEVTVAAQRLIYVRPA